MVPTFYISFVVLKISEVQEKTGVVKFTLTAQSYSILSKPNSQEKFFD